MRAKNAPLDSLEELLLIDGWDQDLQTIFGPYLTIYPYQPVGKSKETAKINLNTASRSLLGCLFPESKGECSEKSALALKTRNSDKTNLGEGKNLKDTLRDALCYTVDDKGANDKSSWFAEQSSVFRVRAEGNVGDQTKVLEVVVERIMPDPKKEQTRSYEILYWKMI
jgi:type II secretory pathway component PulK